MERYDCVVFGCHQLKNTGNGLAKCVDNGIPVVLCCYAITTNYSTQPNGKFASSNYMPMPPRSFVNTTMSNFKVEEEFQHYFDNYHFGSFNAAVNYGSVSTSDENIDVIATATTQNQTTPLIIVRNDKNAPIIIMNAYTNDSYPATIKLLAKCIEISLDYKKIMLNILMNK
eukprot:UN25645